MPQMIIANRLTDGLVVFWAGAERWVTSIEAGSLLDDGVDEALAEAKRDETRCIVIDPSLIEVTIDAGERKPTAIREAIRAFGPTVRTDRPDASREY